MKKSNKAIPLTPLKFLLLFVLFSYTGYPQTTKVTAGDTITSEFVLWAKDEYRPDKTSNFKLSCINKNGDTLNLAKYIGIEFNYPKFCIEMGIHPYKMWYKVVLDPESKIKSLDALRPEHCKDGIKEQLTAILTGSQKILSKKEIEFVIEMRIKVIRAPLKEMPVIKPIEIRRR